MDHDALARRFVQERFPQADTAVLAGSTARGERTATSDIDLLVIGPDTLFDDARDSLAATYAFEGEVFEVFAYTPESFERWARRGLTSHRPVLLTMLLDGRPVREGSLLGPLRERWRPVRDAGPETDAHDLDVRRYIVTDLMDDLRDAVDPLERQVLAALLFEQLGQLLLLHHGQWLGTGKQLPRRMRAWDAARTERLAQPLLRGDHAAFLAAAEVELGILGGRLQAGFVR
jgi:hypothetical protein